MTEAIWEPGMVDKDAAAPERIWAWPTAGHVYGTWSVTTTFGGTEYRRADALAAALAELSRLTAAIAAKGGSEHAPTQWAYDQACAAIEKHRERADAALARVEALEGVANRKQFPILNGGDAKIDWQLVEEHAQQAMSNHGQTIRVLASRGGLSWCELFAVLHNQRWQKIDMNEAMIACRALEARYLAALKGGAA